MKIRSPKQSEIRSKKLSLDRRKPVKTDFRCNFCQLKFTTYLSFKYHFINSNPEKVEERENSTEALAYRCETCDCGFELASELQNHMLGVDHNIVVESESERIEESIRKPNHPCFVCCVCKARFSHMQTLHVHMKLRQCNKTASEDKDDDVMSVDEGM